LFGGNSTIRGLVINRFTVGISARFAGGGDVIAGNFVGTDATGTVSRGNSSNMFIDTSNTTIGGTTPSARNISPGSRAAGVSVTNGGFGVVVQGNYFGTDKNGTAALPNSIGVQINIGSTNSAIVGGSTSGAGNVISGNTLHGILITDAH